MKRFDRLITASCLTILSIILLFSVVFAYLIVTPLGGKILVKYFKQEFSSLGLVHIGHYEGSLHKGFILRDVKVTGLSYLPDALLRIQEIRVHLPLMDMAHSDFRIFNARIFIADSDPIVFTGEVYAGKIHGNLYAKSVDLHAASRFWTNEDIRKNLKGSISNVDLTVDGLVTAPKLNGHFNADKILYQSILLSDGIANVNMVLIASVRHVRVLGELNLDSGKVNVQRVNLGVSSSKIVFNGDIYDPSLSIRLGSKVEDMDIHLYIQGTLLKPQLIVSSDPPMLPQNALQVLFSGNALAASTSPFNGVTSGELAANFFQYSLQDAKESSQLGLKTKLTDNLKLGLEMDQIPSPPGATAIYYSRKINGEIDLTQHMSFNVSQEILPQGRDPSQVSQDALPSAETQVYVQYKKRF